MIGVPIAHVGGIPIEETLGSLGPGLLVGIGVAWTRCRARLRRARTRADAHTPRAKNGPRSAAAPNTEQ
jgi:hypothetical protein